MVKREALKAYTVLVLLEVVLRTRLKTDLEMIFSFFTVAFFKARSSQKPRQKKSKLRERVSYLAK